MKDNLVVTLADKNFVNQAKQLFSSVYYNSGWQGDYMLLADGMKKKDVEWFEEKGIIVKDITDIKFIKDSHIGHGDYIWPNTVLAKFILFTEEFKKWKKIIFLDSDIIVRGSIDKLKKVKSIAAVEDHFSELGVRFKDQTLLKTKKQFKAKKDILKKYHQKEKCFNSGVLAINTEIITSNTFNNLLKLLKDYGELSYGDEPLFNLYFYKKWEKLSKVYNACVPYWMKHYGIKTSEIKCPILHFISRDEEEKPWNKSSPFYREWNSNLEKFDSMSLDKTIYTKKIYTSRDIKRFEKFLELKRIKALWALLNPLYYFDKKKHPHFNHKLDSFLGKIGIFLKIYLPFIYNLYYKIEYHGGLIKFLINRYKTYSGLLGLKIKNNLPFIYNLYYKIKYHGGLLKYIFYLLIMLIESTISKLKYKSTKNFLLYYKIKYHGGFFKFINSYIDKFIGIIGKFIKKISPRIYNKLKRKNE